jgi:hypothetical protein
MADSSPAAGTVAYQSWQPGIARQGRYPAVQVRTRPAKTELKADAADAFAGDATGDAPSPASCSLVSFCAHGLMRW